MTIGALVTVVAVLGALLRLPLWLIGLLAFVTYCLWAYFHPFKACWKCKGTGLNGMSTSRRKGKCVRCHGARELPTMGYRVMRSMVRGLGTARREVGGRKER